MIQLNYRNNLFTSSCQVDVHNQFQINSHLGLLGDLKYFNESSLGVLLINRGQKTESQIYANRAQEAGEDSEYAEFLAHLIPAMATQRGSATELTMGTCFDRVNVFVAT